MKAVADGDARRPDRRRERRALRPDQVPAADQRARPGRARARQDDGHRERLCVDGLFARRFRARRRQGAGRDRGRCRRGPGAERLGPLLLRRLLFGRHRTHAQCRHSGRQLAILGEPVQNWPRGDEGCDRPSGGHAGARERGLERARPAVTKPARQYFRQGRGLPRTASFAASATPCSTIPTSTPPATPAPRSAD